MATPTHEGVAASVASDPIFAVVRTADPATAHSHAGKLASGGARLIKITFTVPEATRILRSFLEEKYDDGDSPRPPWLGMGTVTTAARAHEAVAAGAEFIVSPNASPEVAEVARAAGLYLVMGALTPTEIVAARDLGADLVKVYPLPPVGGATYLSTVRQPLDDIAMLAAGGFTAEEIPAYRQAGARAFGISAQILGVGEADFGQRMARALALDRGDQTV